MSWDTSHKSFDLPSLVVTSSSWHSFLMTAEEISVNINDSVLALSLSLMVVFYGRSLSKFWRINTFRKFRKGSKTEKVWSFGG